MRTNVVEKIAGLLGSPSFINQIQARIINIPGAITGKINGLYVNIHFITIGDQPCR